MKFTTVDFLDHRMSRLPLREAAEPPLEPDLPPEPEPIPRPGDPPVPKPGDPISADLNRRSEVLLRWVWI